MDQLDIAAEFETAERQRALDKTLFAAKEPAQWIENHQVLCLDCTDPISEERLAIKPEAARCIDCQQLKERKNHGRNTR